jgi:phospholipid/cholesterol/gamma-HCH transport system substrate-binding protein
METRAHYIVVGAFVLAVLAGIFAAIIWVARIQFEREGTFYDILVSGSVNGLSEGAPVRYKGVPIGRVESIKLDPKNVERIRVRIAVAPSTPIKQDAVASLETQGITGQAYVQISGGSNASPPLTAPPDQPYPVIPSRPSQLEEFVTSAPQLLNRAIAVADRLEQVLSSENEASLSRILRNLDTLTGGLAKDSEGVNRMVAEGTAAAIELHRTAANASTLLEHLDQAVEDKNGAAAKLSTTLDEFNRSARSLAQATDHLDALIQENRPGLREFTRSGLNQAEQLIADSRALVAALNRVADEVARDPARLLYGDRREGYHPR